MLGQHYHRIDHLAIGTEKIVSFFENKKFITLRIQGDTQKIQVKKNTIKLSQIKNH